MKSSENQRTIEPMGCEDTFIKTMPKRVSIHGGHSGQFCSHARDSLEAIVLRYRELGFAWVGITEHMPPLTERFMYPEERRLGFGPEALMERFAAYMAEARRLQRKLAGTITIYVGVETEGYTGAEAIARRIVSDFHPDYLVGSLHHVADEPFDTDPEVYHALSRSLGGMEALYIRYFDRQFELIKALKPKVVGHFDLVRIFDPAYEKRLALPAVWERVERNLDLVRKEDLILDLNVRALSKGAREPYVSAAVLSRALALGIPVVPGDDSHGVESVGKHVDTAIDLLGRLGADLDWRRPL